MRLADSAVPTQPPLLANGAQRALLINPPIYDIRFPWHQWQQPAILLRLSTYLRQHGTETRFLDYVNSGSGEIPQKKTVARLELDSSPQVVVSKWRYGSTAFLMDRQMRALRDSGWIPDVVYVECFASFWWEGAAESIESARTVFPNSHITLLGGYPETAASHAREHSLADEVMLSPWPEVRLCCGDLSLFATAPKYLCVSTGDGQRTPQEILDEIRSANLRGTSHFAIVGHDLLDRHSAHFHVLLELLIAANLRIKFQALGNVSSAALCRHPDLAELMYHARFEMVCFADDRDESPAGSQNDVFVEQAREATEMLVRAGYRERTGAVTASVSVGRSGESIPDRASLATRLAHHVGSVILWPFQPRPDEFPEQPPDSINGKLFPHRARNGYSYRDYMDLLGLGAVLNAKYRTRTFDFMGEDLIARLFRESVQRKGWDPDPNVKGGLQLPMRVR